MARAKETKVSLTPDQFSINEKDELVIREAEIIKAIQEQQAAALPANVAADKVEVTVSVSVKF